MGTIKIFTVISLLIINTYASVDSKDYKIFSSGYIKHAEEKDQFLCANSKGKVFTSGCDSNNNQRIKFKKVKLKLHNDCSNTIQVNSTSKYYLRQSSSLE
ncbi:MAG: hypothetical protein U9N59_07295, partial [Campylobacterota bacterium]|nr:hypothetical protein [Campylobacterota bacterium]